MEIYMNYLWEKIYAHMSQKNAQPYYIITLYIIREKITSLLQIIGVSL